MLVQEDGPFDVFQRIRDYLQPEGEVGTVGKLFMCVWCMSVWTAALCYLAWSIWEVPVILLAASSIAVIVEEKLTK
jgi:hypothetical protein